MKNIHLKRFVNTVVIYESIMFKDQLKTLKYNFLLIKFNHFLKKILLKYSI